MILKQFTAGPFDANNYLIIDEVNKKAVLIDASGKLDYVKSILDEYGAKLEKILLTHAHIDHIAGCYEFQSKLGAKVFINKGDEFLIQNVKQQLQMFGLPPSTEPQIDGNIADNETIEVGNIKIKAIHTPGHSKGGMCFVWEGNIFTGDTVFLQSVGRTDLPGGDFEELGNSIAKKLFPLEGDYRLYPGHGPATSLDYERKNNPFFGDTPIA